MGQAGSPHRPTGWNGHQRNRPAGVHQHAHPWRVLRQLLRLIPLQRLPTAGLAHLCRRLHARLARHRQLLSLSNAFPQPAWLIYADACTPGWHATVNGKPAPILKAYGALKAVEVQPGVSRVRFDYHTGLRSVCLNAFATLAGCAVALALLWLLWLMLDPNLNRNLDANPFG